jgi:ribokinase
VLDKVPTGTAYIMLYHDRDNCIVLLGGANQQWPTAAEVTEQLREPMTESAVVMLQREVPECVNVAAASLAHSLGKPVFMDVGGTDAPLDRLLLPHIDLISPNEAELSDISGVDTTGDEGSVSMILVRQAVAALKEQLSGAGNPRAEVLVTLGSLGAVHFCSEWANGGNVDSAGLLAGETRSGCFRLATHDGRPRDTTGAGDCFRGSFAAARYVERRSLEESMRWAAAAASLAIEAEGALTSMPSRDRIEKRAAEEMDVPIL